MLETPWVADLGVLHQGQVDCLLHLRSKALAEGCCAKELQSRTDINTLESGQEPEKNRACINLQKSYFDDFACGLSVVYSC